MAAFQILTPELDDDVNTENIQITEAGGATAGMVITTAGALADSNVASTEVLGFLRDDTALNKWGTIIKPNSVVDVTPTLTKGGILILSEDPGKVKYANEIAAGENLIIVAFCTLTTQMKVYIYDAGILV